MREVVIKTAESASTKEGNKGVVKFLCITYEKVDLKQLQIIPLG